MENISKTSQAEDIDEGGGVAGPVQGRGEEIRGRVIGGG